MIHKLFLLLDYMNRKLFTILHFLVLGGHNQTLNFFIIHQKMFGVTI